MEAGGLRSQPLGELVAEFEAGGEAAFRRTHPHPYLLVVFAPEATEEPDHVPTRHSRIPDLALPHGRPDFRRVIALAPRAPDRARVTVGRAADNDLVISSTWISKHHAAFVPQKGGMALEDLGSVNGTLLNGARLVARRGYRLESGDKIVLWRYVFEYLELDALVQMLREPTKPR